MGTTDRNSVPRTAPQSGWDGFGNMGIQDLSARSRGMKSKMGKNVKLPLFILLEKSGLCRKREECLMAEADGWDGGQGRRRLEGTSEAPALNRRQRLRWFQDFDLVTL